MSKYNKKHPDPLQPSVPEPSALQDVRLICAKEAVMPGLGHFKPGDIITEPALIERIGKNHPFFSAEIAPEELSLAPVETKEEGN